MSRPPEEQRKHDARVLEICKKYEKKGWEVKADIPGYIIPPNVAGLRPDILAIKGKKTHIIEVGTESTMLEDAEKRKKFMHFAYQNPKTKFKLEKGAAVSIDFHSEKEPEPTPADWAGNGLLIRQATLVLPDAFSSSSSTASITTRISSASSEHWDTASARPSNSTNRNRSGKVKYSWSRR